MIVPSKIHNTRLVKIQPGERIVATSEELMEKLEENIEDMALSKKLVIYHRRER
jgi:hypothetical protein